MNKPINLLNNEEGSLIVFTLMVLTLLTLIGIAGMWTANTEIEIAGAELIHQTNFYLAEGAAMEAFDILEKDNDPLITPPAWLETTPGDLHEENYTDHATYPKGTSALDPVDEVYFKVGYEGISEGSSEDMTKSKVHDFTIYGRSEKRGVAVIRIGYRKVF